MADKADNATHGPVFPDYRAAAGRGIAMFVLEAL
jgi:hypothetical protein